MSLERREPKSTQGNKEDRRTTPAEIAMEDLWTIGIKIDPSTPRGALQHRAIKDVLDFASLRTIRDVSSEEITEIETLSQIGRPKVYKEAFKRVKSDVEALQTQDAKNGVIDPEQEAIIVLKTINQIVEHKQQRSS